MVRKGGGRACVVTAVDTFEGGIDCLEGLTRAVPWAAAVKNAEVVLAGNAGSPAPLHDVDGIRHDHLRSFLVKRAGAAGSVRSWGPWDTGSKAYCPEEDHTGTEAEAVESGNKTDQDVSTVDSDLP